MSCSPRFVKQYAAIGKEIESAVQRYIDDVVSGAFPSAEYSIGPVDEQVDHQAESGS